MKDAKNVPFVWGLSSFPIELIENLPEISCIYFITHERSREVIYVGQTVNLKYRFVDHHRLIQFLELTGGKPDTVHVRWCPVPQRALRTVEREAIRYYCPTLNYRKVLKFSKKDTKNTKSYKVENLMLKIKNVQLETENSALRQQIRNRN